MRVLAQIISGIALAASFIAPIIFLAGAMPLLHMKTILFAATVAWFLSAPFWMGGELNDKAIGE